MDQPDPPAAVAHQREMMLFAAALERPAEARAVFLDGACHGDPALRGRLDALLAAHDKPANELAAVNTDAAIEPQDEAVGQTLGRYKLLEKLGEGGCGAVYVAEQTEPVRRRVALKIIKLGMDTKDVIARFEVERQALAIMDHPNIAKVLDAGTTETGRPYFVMELVRGIRITDYCDQASLSMNERLDLFIKVCQAIQHAHQKGIIHRDIKPSNILVTLHDSVPVPKVIDFGIAKATEGRLTEATVYTQLHQFIGTPAYMSPEQAEMSGLDIDTRSDIYSLGVLLYELLTGVTPFDAQTLLQSGLDEMRRIIREEEPKRPSTRLSTLAAASLSDVAHHRHTEAPKLLSLIRGDLDWIVMKCLEKDRTRRYDTANGLAADIQRHLKQEPVAARPPSTAYRFQKLVRRNKVAFAAAAMVLGALVLGLGMATWSFMRERVARVEADSGRQEAEQAGQREQRERQRAEQSAARAHAATTRLEIEKAEQLFGADNSATALAYLARILRRQPTNRVVAERILSALGQRNVCLPVVAFRHDAPVTSAQFSHDGARVVTSSKDNTARVWDSRTGQPLTLGLQHGDDVLHTCFSRDGRKVATASRDSTARVWDSHTGQALTGPLQHTGAVVFVEFSPDGQLVATASEDLTARVWDSVTGLPITEPLMHSNTVTMVRFSPDGNWLLSCSKDHFGRVWNARTGQLRSQPMGEGANVWVGQFFADSRRVMIAGGSGCASLWDSVTGTRSKRFLHDRYIKNAALSPDESRLVTAGAYFTARIWDITDPGTPVTSKQLHDLKHGDLMITTCFSRNGRLVATGSADHTARIWSVQTGQPLTEPLNHDASLLSVEFSPDDQRLLTVAEQNFALVWDIRSGQPLAQYFADSAGESHYAAFSRDGQWVFADADGIARVWDRFTGQLILATIYGNILISLELSPGKGSLAVCRTQSPAEIWKLLPDGSAAGLVKIGRNVNKAAFNPNGDQVALAEGEGLRVQVFDPNFYNVQIFDPNTGKPLSPMLPHALTVKSLEFSTDGERLLTAAGLKARIWNARTGAVEAEMQHNNAIVQARFSLDGNWVITASEDKTAAIWDWRKPGEALRILHHAAEVNWAELSQDAQLAVTVSLNSARVWDVKSGRLVSPPLTHLSGVNRARFSSDARRIITTSGDSTARIWDVQSGHALSEPLRHAGNVKPAEFSSDGRWAVTASTQGKNPCIWEVPAAAEAVPAWLPRLAEAVAGQRFDHEGVSEPVSAEELLALRADLAAGRGSGAYDIWAKWFFDSSAKRKLSPSAQLTISDLVQREIKQGTAAALERAVELCPTNALPYARLASLNLTNETLTDDARLADSDWQSRYALKLSPDDPEVWHARAEFCERLGKSVEAFEAMRRSISFNPTNPAIWNRWGQLLEKNNRFEDAFDGYTRAIELSGRWISAQKMPALAYRNRSRVLKRLNRLSEATADNLKSFDIIPRPTEASANMIDLSAHYNGSVLQGWMPPFTPDRVAKHRLPNATPGVLTLQGVVFDVRGVIQLQGLDLQKRGGPFQERFQERINGIVVNQRCRRLHFLHATAWNEANGRTIGRYIIHYASGEMEEIPINYGEDLRNWRTKGDDPSEATRATTAWKGEAPASGVRLFKKTWDNPKPDLVIKQMDLVSTMTQSAPFIVAITADPISE